MSFTSVTHALDHAELEKSWGYLQPTLKGRPYIYFRVEQKQYIIGRKEEKSIEGRSGGEETARYETRGRAGKEKDTGDGDGVGSQREKWYSPS